MNRFFCLMCGVVLCMVIPSYASNVRITSEPTIPSNTVVGNVAVINVSVEWENSWRDNFNWDAVYVFFKCKKKTETTWQHVYLMSSYHEVSPGYSYWMMNNISTANNYSKGVFVYRGDKMKCHDATSSVELKLKWDLTKNGYDRSSIIGGEVDITAMCIEMVYIPKGPFAIGDGYSAKTLGKVQRTILPEWDIVKNDGIIKYVCESDPESDVFKSYPPERAANRVSCPDGSNAWQSSKGTGAKWQIIFKEPKTVRWFGVSGSAANPANRPITWTLEGSNDGRQWNELWRGDASKWGVDGNSYPVKNAQKIEHPTAYLCYQINILSSSYVVMANNIAMTEKDLGDFNNDALIVDRTTMPINSTTGLWAVDGDPNWSASALDANYPSGYEGFYMMKYEISQDQYTRFLNKLTLAQQKERTIGAGLTSLSEGAYVYGTQHISPAFRNGIVISAKSDACYVFANNLNSVSGLSAEDDGQTLACNYLSPADMLAYADWTGLRPLSEMEYEKAVRGLYPELPLQGEWAWNSNDVTTLSLPASATFTGVAGSRNEILTGANVNADAKAGGPVRCGSFATTAGGKNTSGSSYWGIKELSGNLAEIYYNVNYYGRVGGLRGIWEAHGDGALDANGNGNVNAGYCPQRTDAFMLRGGSFKDVKEKITISDRTNGLSYFSGGWNTKDETTSFRVGASYTQLVVPQCTTYLKLENGKVTTADNVAWDTVCSGSTYHIVGSPLLESSSTTSAGRLDIALAPVGKCSYYWYSTVDGSNWELIPGANERDLDFNLTGNDGPAPVQVLVRRLTVTATQASQTAYARLYVVNNNYTINRRVDTLNTFNQVLGFLAETRTPANYTWKKLMGVGYTAVRQVSNVTSDFYYADRENDFKKETGSQKIECEIRVLGKCVQKIPLEVYVKPRPMATKVGSGQITMGGTNRELECGVLMQDTRDNNVYGTVKIGNQCWMAENLRYRMDGYTIYRSGDNEGKRFGGYYRRNTQAFIDNICPPGWRLPTEADFTRLLQNLDDGLGQRALKLRAGNYWNINTANKSHMGKNSSGFGAIGAGHYDNSGNYNAGSANIVCYFVMSDSDWYYYLDFGSYEVQRHYYASINYMSVRCIKK